MRCPYCGMKECCGATLAERLEVATRPSWDYAPEWAQYLAQDSDGHWHWHERLPKAEHGDWSNKYGRTQKARWQMDRDWTDTLEERPQ